jgi:hypothetical protein
MVRDWALTLHEGQRYGNKPYSFHLEGVAEKTLELAELILEHTVGEYHDNLLIAIMCAYLHDSVEDEKASANDIYNFLSSINLDEIMRSRIMVAVDALTRRDDETYPQYILNRICNNGCHITKLVKVADLRFNKEQNLKAMAAGKKHFKHMYDKYSFAEFIVMQSVYTKI